MDWGRGREEEAGSNVPRPPRKLFLTVHIPALPLTHTLLHRACPAGVGLIRMQRKTGQESCVVRVFRESKRLRPGSRLTSDVITVVPPRGLGRNEANDALLLRAALLNLWAEGPFHSGYISDILRIKYLHYDS